MPQIVVNAASTSAMPGVLRPSVFTFAHPPPKPAFDALIADLKPGLVEIDISKRVFQDAWSTDDCVRRAAELVPTLQAIEAAGGVPMLAIARIPQHLSSDDTAVDLVAGVIPRWSVIIPDNWTTWRDCVRDCIEAIHDALGHTPLIKIGWEPDTSQWAGTEAEYFLFYQHTSAGVKLADATALVGGPGVSSLYTGKTANIDMFPQFLSFVSSNALPLDFVVWHTFNAEPLLSYAFSKLVVQSWLTATSLSTALPLIIGEWSSWESVPSATSVDHDAPLRAAHAIATAIGMSASGYNSHAMTSLVEQADGADEPFIGSFGIFNNHFIKKPIYHALKMLTMLGDTRVATTSDDNFVFAVAGRISESRIRVIVTVHTPSLQMFQRTAAAYDIGIGAGAGDTYVGPIANAAELVRGTTRAVTVRFDNMPWKNARATMYKIDATHGNPQAIEASFLTRLEARYAEEVAALNAGLNANLLSLGYSQAEINTFTAVQADGDPRAALFALAEPSRIVTVAIADAASQYIAARLATIGAEVNILTGAAMIAEPVAVDNFNRTVSFSGAESGTYLIDIETFNKPSGVAVAVSPFAMFLRNLRTRFTTRP